MQQIFGNKFTGTITRITQSQMLHGFVLSPFTLFPENLGRDGWPIVQTIHNQ
jgi:hypothetical protein